MRRIACLRCVMPSVAPSAPTASIVHASASVSCVRPRAILNTRQPTYQYGSGVRTVFSSRTIGATKPKTMRPSAPPPIARRVVSPKSTQRTRSVPPLVQETKAPVVEEPAPVVVSPSSYGELLEPDIPEGESQTFYDDIAFTLVNQPFEQRSLNVVMIGTPNAGKSILTNALIRNKVTAVSGKKNTTRAAVIIPIPIHLLSCHIICWFWPHDYNDVIDIGCLNRWWHSNRDPGYTWY